MEAELEEMQAWRGRENDVILQCSIIVKKLFYNTPEIGIFEYPVFPSPIDCELYFLTYVNCIIYIIMQLTVFSLNVMCLYKIWFTHFKALYCMIHILGPSLICER